MKKLLALSLVITAMATSTATANVQLAKAPHWFVKQALCVHSHEAPIWRWSPSYHPGYTYWNGYWTGLQFLRSTWRRANRLLGMYTPAGTGNRRLVILHAYAIVREDGWSWREWRNTARLCGLNTN